MNTPVSLLNSPSLQNAYLLVSKEIQSKPQTFVFSIDKNTGGIYYAGIPNIDIFPSQESAIQYLKSTYNLVFDNSQKNNPNQATIENIGQSLIGATIFDNKLAILCVQEHELVTKLFDQPIYKITEVSYTLMDLNPKSVFAPSSAPYIFINSYTQLQKHIKGDSFLRYDIRNNHFYSPILDMNTQFPYKQNTITNGPFCWNKRFLIPFEDNNCLKSCIIVYQGGVYNFTKENASITYIIKRSSMFPGTRYNARGLKITSSKLVEPANECECELIFSDGTYYYSQTWRRGSPPVFWKSEMTFLAVSSKLLKNPSKLTSTYFYQHIIRKFRPSRVQIVSLLSNKNKEKEMNDVYEEGFKNVDFVSKNNDHVNLGFTRFDINDIYKRSNEDISFIATEMFRNLQNPIERSDFTRTEITGIKEQDAENTENLSASTSIETENDENDETKKKVHVTKKLRFDLVPPNAENKQSVVFRFNCADSLDRTNIGTFFYGVLITAKFIFQKNIYCFMNQKAHQIRSKSNTLWKNPFEYLNSEVINFLKASFIDAGNVISQLYTSTDAIKSGIIDRTTSESSQKSKPSSDSIISVLRRIKNYANDPTKQKIIEEWTRTFQIKIPRFVLDQQHLSFYELKENECDHSIFELKEKDFLINSNGNITAMFPEPLFLYQVSLLVFRKNINDNTTLTLQIGNNKKDESIFFKDLLLPIINPKVSSKDHNPNDCYVWVTYNLRKIASYSNIYPIEPESLKLSSFVNLQFCCKNNTNNNAKIRIGSIKFVVKKPNSSLLNQMKKISSMNPQEASTQLLKINSNSRILNNHRYMLKGNDSDQKELISKIYDESFTTHKDYFSIIKTANKSIDYSLLPNLDELMTSIMKWIQYGISDYNNFQTFVDHFANPWIFNLSSRIHAQNSKNICPICGKKVASDKIIKSLREKQQKESNEKDSNINHRELLRESTVYMPNPVFPLFYMKTINLNLITKAESEAIFLCNECSIKYDDLMIKCNIKPKQVKKEDNDNDNDNENDNDNDNDDDEDEDEEVLDNNELDDLKIQSNIISSYIGNFVKINDISDIQQYVLPLSFENENNNDFSNGDDIVNLNKIARIYDFPQNSSADELNLALHSSDSTARLIGTDVEFSVCFASFVCPTEVEFVFAQRPNEPFDFTVNVQGVDENVAAAKENKHFCYEIRIPKNEKGEIQPIQSMSFRFKSEKENNFLFKEININGHVNKDPRKTKRNGAIINFNEEIQLPASFKANSCNWNLTMRSQTFLPNKNLPTKISGLSIYFSPNDYSKIPKYFVVAFYLNQNIVHKIPIILPSDVSKIGFIEKNGSKNQPSKQQIDHFYFPITDQQFHDFDFDLISVFYVEKSSSINQLNFMFF